MTADWHLHVIIKIATQISSSSAAATTTAINLFITVWLLLCDLCQPSEKTPISIGADTDRPTNVAQLHWRPLLSSRRCAHLEQPSAICISVAISVWVVVSSSAYNQISSILLMRDHWANWHIQPIFPAKISEGEAKWAPVSQRRGDRIYLILRWHRTAIVAPPLCFSFQMHSFLSGLDHLKFQILKSYTFFTRCKN